ncbi:hypothetical protein GO283_05122 [Ralstonia solanacearum]|nr:hypothetical protein [Ralstonia solanacearum]
MRGGILGIDIPQCLRRQPLKSVVIADASCGCELPGLVADDAGFLLVQLPVIPVHIATHEGPRAPTNRPDRPRSHVRHHIARHLPGNPTAHGRRNLVRQFGQLWCRERCRSGANRTADRAAAAQAGHQRAARHVQPGAILPALLPLVGFGPVLVGQLLIARLVSLLGLGQRVVALAVRDVADGPRHRLARCARRLLQLGLPAQDLAQVRVLVQHRVGVRRVPAQRGEVLLLLCLVGNADGAFGHRAARGAVRATG